MASNTARSSVFSFSMVRCSAVRNKIADEALGIFADVIGIAGDAVAVKERESVQGLEVNEAADQIGGGAEIPIETGAPVGRFVVEQRGQVVGRDPAQVDYGLVMKIGERRHSVILPCVPHTLLSRIAKVFFIRRILA